MFTIRDDGAAVDDGAAAMRIVPELPSGEANGACADGEAPRYEEAERLLPRHDGGAERDLMLSGIDKLQRGGLASAPS